MNTRITKIKNHLVENKITYFVGSGCTIVGGAVMVIVIGRSAEGAEIAQKIVQIGFKNDRANNIVINLIENSTPSKPVHLVGTNLFFNSLSEAARETGHDLSALSRHINGHSTDIKGDVFQLLEAA